jgi:hypothetical protein
MGCYWSVVDTDSDTDLDIVFTPIINSIRFDKNKKPSSPVLTPRRRSSLEKEAKLNNAAVAIAMEARVGNWISQPETTFEPSPPFSTDEYWKILALENRL